MIFYCICAPFVLSLNKIRKEDENMKKLFSVLCALVIGFSFASLTAAAGGKADIYVSVNGSDLNDGSVSAPLKTVRAAKEKLKELKGGYSSAEVHLSEGTYPFDDTLYFTADDMGNTVFSGTGDVRFSGSYKISGFEETTVNGVRCFVKKLDGNADFKSLFNGEKQLAQPRYPETGYFTVKATDPANDIWTEENAPWSLTLGQRSFFADKNDVAKSFKNESDVVIRILHYWHDEMMTVTGIDRETGRIGLSRPSTMLIRDIDRYYFENVFEAMNEPGEWYLDTNEDVLYYVPEENEEPGTTVLSASSLERLIDINGADGISFKGIRFEDTDWNVTDPAKSAWWSDWRTEHNVDAPQAAFDVNGVITVNNASDVHFINCEFINLGATAVKLEKGVKDSSVENCYFENIAATGIFIGGDNSAVGAPESTGNITVRNCEIYRYGRKFFCAIGIQITYCDTAYIENNEIHDGYYTGISDGWVWGYAYQLTRNVSIKNNLIYNIGQGWLSDMGGIYTLGIQPGTVLSGNVIHNVAADAGEGGYGGWGIYLDEGSSQILVEKNLVFACGSDGYHLHYGGDNTLTNNIFALNSNSQMRVCSKNEGHLTADIFGNILLTDGAAPVVSHARKTEETAVHDNWLWNLSDEKAIYFIENDDLKKAMSLATAERKDFAADNITADPMFTDPDGFDFTFSENSPVLAAGFEKWDYTEAGTLKDSVIGIAREGGKTAYNDSAVKMSYSEAKEKLPFINMLINRLYSIFAQLKKMFAPGC